MANFGPQSGTLTAGGQAVTLTGLTGVNVILAGIGAGGTGNVYVGATLILEGSYDGTTFKPIRTLRLGTNYPDGYNAVMADNDTRAWRSIVSSDWVSVRLRAVALTSGTVSVILSAVSDGQSIYPPCPELLFSQGGTQSVAVGAGGSGDSVVVCACPARLNRVCISTATPSAIAIFFDNPTTGSGSALFTTLANAPLGTIYDVGMPFLTGITVLRASGSPQMGVSYTPMP